MSNQENSVHEYVLLRKKRIQDFLDNHKIHEYMIKEQVTPEDQKRAVSIAVDLLLQRASVETYPQRNACLAVFSAESVYMILNHHGLAKWLAYSRTVT